MDKEVCKRNEVGSVPRMALQRAHFTGQVFPFFLMTFFFSSMKLCEITSNNNLLLSWNIEVKEQKAELQRHWRAENGHPAPPKKNKTKTKLMRKWEVNGIPKLWKLQRALRTAWHKENEK